MKFIEQKALGGSEQFERYDKALAKHIFGEINESWEEAYAELVPEDWDKDIPRDFLVGRQAFIHSIFYRVLMLHQAEAKIIEEKGLVHGETEAATNS